MNQNTEGYESDAADAANGQVCEIVVTKEMVQAGLEEIREHNLGADLGLCPRERISGHGL